MTYTDLAYARDAEGLYDLVIDPATRDLATTDGLDSALFVSLFSDRRARSDEVADPLNRRGWIGNLVSEVPNDNHGSGLWLYEQRRLSDDVAIGIRLEAEQALEWLVQERLATVVTAAVTTNPADRSVSLRIQIGYPDGTQNAKAFALADRTAARSLIQTY